MYHTVAENDQSGSLQLDRAKLANAILSSALDCIVVSDSHGRIVEFNAAAERTFGWAREEMLGKGMDETIVPHRHREGHRKGMARFLAGGAARVVGKRVETEGLHADGHIFPIELSITETQMDQRRYFVATLRDITAQKQAEIHLQETQATLRAIFDNVPAALYLRDRNDTLVMMNNWGAEFLGREPASMIGHPMSKFREQQNVDRVKAVDENIVRTGNPETHEFTYHLPGGDRTGLMTFFPVSDNDGEVTHIGGMLLDVTELHKARAELQQVKAMLESVFDNIPAELYLRELDGSFVMMNKWGANFYGQEPSQMVGQLASAYDTGSEIELAKKAQERLLATGKPVTQEYHYKVDGRQVKVQNTIFPVKDAEGKIVRIGGVTTDVTELNNARNQRDEAQFLIQSIFDNAPVELYLRELDGRYIMMNRWGANYFGVKPQDLLGGNFVWSYDSEEETMRARKAQATLLETGKPVTREFLHKVDGKKIAAQNTIFPIRDSDGRIVRIGGISIDMTDLNHARDQLQRAQENLHQSEKLAALGQLLAGVAHELNNPLAVVLGRASILQEKLADTPHAAPLQKLREAADRCTRIVKTFLAMARQTGPRRELVEVNELIESALEMTTYSLRKSNINYTTTHLAKPHFIDVDPDQMIQVLTNLILNAQHALEEKPEGRAVEIGASLSDDRQWLSLVVADNGPGVPAGIAARIFDPFFTTKSVGQGTGLGLSVCRSMVEAHGGALKLEASPGGGATFRVSLPAHISRTSANQKDPITGSALQMRGRILVVDDEVEIAAILADCLTPLGIECIIASDGHSGLARIGELTFDGIFCDVSMPGMDGISFFHKLKQTNPALADRLIFISGDVLHRDWDKIKSSIDRPILEKPFDPQQVRDAAMLLLTAGRDQP